MDRKLIFAACIIGMAVMGGLFGAMSLGKAGGETVPSTVDIGQAFPPGVVEIKAASFQPAVTEKEAISTVREMLRDSFGIANPEALPTEATIALFSGPAQYGHGEYVQDVPVWIVVVKEVPFGVSGGPRGTGDSPPEGGKVGLPQYNVAIDADTGVVVHGVMSGKVIK